jgi:peptide/nickel transport system permease protein
MKKRHWLSRGAFVVAIILILVAIFAPLLAWDQPIVCKYQGAYHFPAVADTFSRLPLVGGWIQKAKPFRFPSFDARTALDADDFALWPLVPFGPSEMVADSNLAASDSHWLGTDDRGRDVLSRLIHGTRVSVRVGVYSMLLAGLVGIIVGAVAGFYGGTIDWICSRFIEVMMCFPAFFLILVVMVWVGHGLTGIILVIGLTQWTSIARLVRAEFLSGREMDFVDAARSYGAKGWYIALRHLLPAAIVPALVALTFGVADAILLEAGLSWLGLGVGSNIPTWGGMLRDGYDQIRTHPSLMVAPCAAIFVSVLCCHVLGEHLRRSLDPRRSFGRVGT